MEPERIQAFSSILIKMKALLLKTLVIPEKFDLSHKEVSFYFLPTRGKSTLIG
jgi:hypothetical protein